MRYGATPVVQPAGAGQAAATLDNTDGKFGGLTISNPPAILILEWFEMSAIVPGSRGQIIATGCVLKALAKRWGQKNVAF